MDFLGGLGNLFHAIGGFISGGSNSNQNSQPIGTVHPQQFVATPPTSSYSPASNNNTTQPKPANTIDMQQPLQKAQPAPAPDNFVEQLTSGALRKAQPNLPPQQSPNLFDRAITTGADAVARTAVGIPEGISQLVGLLPGNPTKNITQGLHDAGAQIDEDQNKNGLNTMIKVDGEPVNLGDAIYHGAQVGLNVGPMVEGVANGITKIPALVKAAPDIIKSIPDAVKAIPDAVQGAGNAIDGLMDRVSPVMALNKANTATDVVTPLSTADRTADEVAVGVRSANPNQASDATQQIAEKQAQAATVPTAQPTTAPPTTPVSQPATPVAAGENTPVITPPAPAQPVTPSTPENASLPNNVAPNANEVNPIPTGRTAPNAPNVRTQLTKQLGDAAKAAGDPTEHNVLSNGELDQAAQRVVQNSAPEEILSKYSGVPKLDNAQDLAHAKASLSVLADLTKNENPEVANAAKQAIDNIMEGTEKGLSGAGRSMNYAQSMYDSLPNEAKISLTIRTLDKARDAAGMPLIKDDPALQNQIEATLSNMLQKGDDIRNQLAAVEGRIQEIQDAAKTAGTALKPAEAQAYSQELNHLATQQSRLQLMAQAQNGDTARYYSSLTPGKAALQKAADWARTSMLTAPSGRINNLFNVSGNALYEITRSIPQAVLNKGVNAFGGAGKTEGSSLLNRGLVRGFVNGLKRVGSELRGNVLVDDLSKSTLEKGATQGSYELTRTADNKGLNKVVNTTQSLVKAPSNIVGGAIRDAQTVRMAQQEGQAAGLTGDALRIYTQSRSLVPSKQMAAKAQQLQDVVSHMNKNPFADMASKIFGDSSRLNGNAKGAVGLIKNTFLPFPKYAATFAWNTLTDRNVVADTVRAMAAIKSGDVNALTKAISGFAVDGTAMYVGYHLADSGVITTKDANGYSDSGAYLHLGDRYIPLGTLGVVAEPLLAGTAIHDAVNSNGNAADKFMSTIWDTTFNTIKTAGAQNLVGADNQGLNAIQKAVTGTDNVTPADAAAIVGGQAVGQFIPGAASDVNSVLNHTGLNPTGEAADTTVSKGSLGVNTKDGNPSTAKAIPQSELLSLENRVPVLSQTLPRKADTTANDFLDRMTRGSHVGQTQGAALQKAQTEADKVKADVAAGVPVYNAPSGTYPKGVNFDDMVESTIEKGDYDKAIKGLQGEVDKLTSTDGIPDTKTRPVKDKIAQLQILKQQGLPPSFRDLYSKVTNTEWRNLGDPNSSTYNPQLYQALYNFDQALSKAGISGGGSGNPGTNDSPKFYAKNGSGSGGKGNSAAALVKSNKIGSIPAIGRENFVSNLSAKPVSANIPQVKLTSPDTLIKAHKISVGFPRGNYN